MGELTPPEGDWLRSFTIVTTAANTLVAPIQDRMPVIVDPSDYAVWLGEGDGPPLAGIVEIDLKYFGGAPKRRKDGQKSKRDKGTRKPKVLIAVQRDDRIRAIVFPTETASDIQAALTGVVAQSSVVFSDKDFTFVNVMKTFGVGHQTVVHSAKEFVRGEVHSNTADAIGALIERARMGV